MTETAGSTTYWGGRGGPYVWECRRDRTTSIWSCQWHRVEHTCAGAAARSTGDLRAVEQFLDMAAAAPKTPLANGQHQQQGLLNGGSSHVPRLRPLFKGMCIGVAIGVVYSLSMWYIVTQLKLPIGIGLRYSANSSKWQAGTGIACNRS